MSLITQLSNIVKTENPPVSFLPPMPLVSSIDTSAYILPRRSFYLGESLNENPQGLGAACFTNGTWMMGYWNEGSADGEGIIFFPDEQFYCGELKSGLKEGLGTMRFADGITYAGSWRKDQRNGEGVLRDREGNIVYIGQ